MTRLALCAIALALTGCAQIHSTEDGRKLVHYDEGGHIGHRVADVHNLGVAGRGVEIRGYCASACTMYLGAADACVHPDARLAFHSAVPLGDTSRDALNAIMAKRYPPALREWFYASGAADRWFPKVLTGAQVIAMGARLCEG